MDCRKKMGLMNRCNWPCWTSVLSHHFLYTSRDLGPRFESPSGHLCHGRIRLRMKFSLIALSFFHVSKKEFKDWILVCLFKHTEVKEEEVNLIKVLQRVSERSLLILNYSAC